jgi:hydroxypyruvate isomerase
MPRLCANISLLFNEVSLPERFAAAAAAGFEAVEIQFPYEFEGIALSRAAHAAGVEVVLINLPAGDWSKGERGIACLPGRETEFRDGVDAGIRYARALGCRRINCLSGIAPSDGSAGAMRETFISNLRYAADRLSREGIELMIEPQNTRTFPGVYLRGTAQALAVMDEVNTANLKLQYDVFHMQIMEGDVSTTIASNIGRIGHVQVADVPGRHEPGSGELNIPYILRRLDELRYAGWVGAEYVPAAATAAGLAWARPWLRKLAA